MIKHIVVIDKCKGCGKCIEACGLELWELVDNDNSSKKIAKAVSEAAVICHLCLCCRDACPENAITVVEE